MNRYLLLVGLAVLLLGVWLCGCIEEETLFTGDERFFGIWKNRSIENEIIIFYPDGTWDSSGLDGRWTIENNQLILTAEDTEVEYTYDYSFSKGDMFLTLTDVSSGITKTYIQQ